MRRARIAAAPVRLKAPTKNRRQTMKKETRLGWFKPQKRRPVNGTKVHVITLDGNQEPATFYFNEAWKLASKERLLRNCEIGWWRYS